MFLWYWRTGGSDCSGMVMVNVHVNTYVPSKNILGRPKWPFTQLLDSALGLVSELVISRL